MNQEIITIQAGDTALYPYNEMRFQVRILDTRKAYGRTDALITPVHGVGEKWVEADVIFPVRSR